MAQVFETSFTIPKSQAETPDISRSRAGSHAYNYEMSIFNNLN